MNRRAMLRHEPGLIEPDATLSDVLAELAARMTAEQRGAFFAKMAVMDRQRGDLSPAAATAGRA